MPIRKKNNDKKWWFEGVNATAVRAVIAVDRVAELPYIEMTFKVKKRWAERHEAEEIVITMPLTDSSKFTQEMLNAITAATPRMPRAPIANPWG